MKLLSLIVLATFSFSVMAIEKDFDSTFAKEEHNKVFGLDGKREIASEPKTIKEENKVYNFDEINKIRMERILDK